MFYSTVNEGFEFVSVCVLSLYQQHQRKSNQPINFLLLLFPCWRNRFLNNNNLKNLSSGQLPKRSVWLEFQNL